MQNNDDSVYNRVIDVIVQHKRDRRNHRKKVPEIIFLAVDDWIEFCDTYHRKLQERGEIPRLINLNDIVFCGFSIYPSINGVAISYEDAFGDHLKRTLPKDANITYYKFQFGNVIYGYSLVDIYRSGKVFFKV